MMIARAEGRRGLLEQLSAMGMKAAERLANRTWAPEVGEEAARHGVAFAKVSRAIRLTLMLEARIDVEILALCSGVTPTSAAWLEPGAEPVRARRGGLREREAIEARDDDAEARADREFDRLPSGGFRACVAEICDDLGLEPDSSLWSDEDGFLGDDGLPVTDLARWAAPEESPFLPLLHGEGRLGRKPERGGGVGGALEAADFVLLASPPRSASRSRSSP